MGCCTTRIDYQNRIYSRPIQNQNQNESAIYRHPQYTDELLTVGESEISTIQDIYLRSFRTRARRPFLGTQIHKKYVWKTYGEVFELSQNFGSGLINLQLVSPTEDEGRTYKFFGLYSKNREEWIVADAACTLYNFTTITFYDALGGEAMEYMLEQTQLITILLSGENVEKVIAAKLEGKTSSLQSLIVMDDISVELQQRIDQAGLRFFKYLDVIEQGRQRKQEFAVVQPLDVYTLCYTSGTTGLPKGAIITHQSLVANSYAVNTQNIISQKDTHISYLPLAHVFERINMITMANCGGQIGFFGGDILKLRDDLQILRPTLLAVVPRLLTRFYDVINGLFAEQTGTKAKLIRKALASKRDGLRRGQFTHAFYDALVFKKTKAVLGGRVKTIVTGSAPIKSDILEFLKICFACNILEGYGQTECGAVATITNKEDPTAGHVGGPIPSTEIKLIDIPEMNYTSKDVNEHGDHCPRGEICFRGPAVTPGYFKLPDKTKEAIDDEGWLHSGDVGEIQPNGSIKIIDRAKNIFKLAQGEYVAPEKIEGVYSLSKYITMIFVYGDSLQPVLVAIIFPDEQVAKKWANENNHSLDFQDICNSAEFKKTVLDDLNRLGRENGLLSFEQVRNIHLISSPFSIESGVMTPTFKVNRFNAKKYFLDEINNLYAS